MSTYRWRCVLTFAAAVLCSRPSVEAATIYVVAGGDLQGALNSAQPGDTVMLEANAEFVGNFVLPVKAGEGWVTLRTATPDVALPPEGVRIQPAHAALLARLRSPNTDAALKTAPGAHHWAIRYLEFRANLTGAGDIIQLGSGSSAQNSLTLVPHHIVLSHVYVHGDPAVGQKRGIALNAAHVTIRDSFIAECKGIGQDTQAIGGWNGPGPYTIENNYLEAAGENVMFGGADPAIPNLVADGIIVRRNYFSRPMSWRNPILSTPDGVSASPTADGALPAGVYSYRVVARRKVQSTFARSKASVEVTVTTTSEGGVRIQWQPVAGASEYLVYGRSAGAQGQYWAVATAEFIDRGTVGTLGTPPTAASLWTVKNLFELKNARNVLVQNNVFENHWQESQSGWAIVFTPRNSQGACTWCVVEHVRFEGNLVRNAASGINVLGFDNGYPSGQAADITIKQNVFQLSTTFGGKGWFVQLGDGPRDIAIEHNTVDANGTALVYAYGGTAAAPATIMGFRFISNAARHNATGINGYFFTYGLGILNGYYPGYVWETSYLADGPGAQYPVVTLVESPFDEQFVNVGGGDYTVRTGSVLKRAASDGTDIGADYPALVAALDGVEAGVPPGARPPVGVPPTAEFSAACQFLVCAFTDASTAGTAAIDSVSWNFGDGSGGAFGTPANHTYAAAGSYTVTSTVTDRNGLVDSMAKMVVVQAPMPPMAALTVSCAFLTCNFADASRAGSGAISSYAWTFGDGAATVDAKAGTHTFATAGSYVITITVIDIYGLSSSASQTVTVIPATAHAGYSGSTTSWSGPGRKTRYWSASITVTVHDADEQPIAGAAVTAVWTGAVAKTSSCVTDAAGKCVLTSGTLSYRQSTVTLNATAVAVPGKAYDPSANHNQAGVRMTAFTVYRP